MGDRGTIWLWRFDQGIVTERRFLRGQPQPGDNWRKVAESIYSYAGDIYQLSVRFRDGRLAARGQVESENVRESILNILGSYEFAGEVRTVIEVTARFKSATTHRHEATQRPPSDAPATDLSNSVERFPAITAFDVPKPGEVFRFSVNLLRSKHQWTIGDSVVIRDLDSDWSDLDLAVEIVSQELTFEAGANVGTIKIIRNADSVAASFEARVSSDTASQSVLIDAVFHYNGRYSGRARRDFELVNVSAPGASTSGVPHRAPDGVIDVDRKADSPELLLAILSASQPNRYIFYCTAPKARKAGGKGASGIVDLGLDGGQKFAQSLLVECPTLPPKCHESALRGIGERIWQSVPSVFKDVYWDLREEIGPNFPIQIVTDEPYVPWEMMRPDEGDNPDEHDHLFMSHPISRWCIDFERGMPNTFGHGIIATCVPEYRSGATLPAAREEEAFLVSSYGAKKFGNTCGEFKSFWTTKLPEDHVTLLHFAGHGYPAMDGQPARIRLSDGDVSTNDIHSGVTLGKRDTTFVILNACDVGSSDVKLGLVDNWASKLTERRFGGLLAPIWKVKDETASMVVRDYVTNLMDGDTVGNAMLIARVAGRRASATPFAYICYGDVMARVAQAVK
ncbi:CHAT domain-containing protein [Mesorhizobium cantuariense]|uniref:CHAT domain-containing protein n=1 Tax=Mesorhizobium cantuariense TaxID=1300275 RepID=A0ABV7MGQ1_9HYPH